LKRRLIVLVILLLATGGIVLIRSLWEQKRGSNCPVSAVPVFGQDLADLTSDNVEYLFYQRPRRYFAIVSGHSTEEAIRAFATKHAVSLERSEAVNGSKIIEAFCRQVSIDDIPRFPAQFAELDLRGYGTFLGEEGIIRIHFSPSTGLFLAIINVEWG
jgi:hypothetical protein